ncbi:MAG: hypothetical protein ACI9VR_004948, partial [Cognaticolwellia sp.]
MAGRLELSMSTTEQNKAAIHTLLKGIETGAPKA